ncbi:major facilitator superfamily protein [Natrinema pellirubrum DSM 15624]|uniref:Arabinose efflux permease family protein n=1 Tax=Natrinema pellirubrum (strain DSM 15624 / CIP 106293 / JCM 10476 / NCIMB 786 / 157) TaxID=797303 RepID=L0JR90_NATP1|nr:MFS transporter [Natrinema pellirubrum]AGB32886.1 arabinose efflux permease family protein [Natrinema pellirubrum DSM 15624]ELY75646.1 major facilitator superfamily protein [Natrinema pellirubrum DSM 15624]
MSDRWLVAWGLGSVAFGGASLLIPLYIVQLGASPVQLGLLAATAAAVGAPGAIAFGRAADRVDRRRLLVLATLAGVAGSLAAIPFLRSITAVIAANAVLWLLVSSIGPVLTMLVVDDAPESAWSERIGLVNSYQGYGWAGGLVLGTVWPVVGSRLLAAGAVTRALFWLLAACAAVSAILAARTLPRPAPSAHVTGDRAARRIGRLLATSSRGVKGATFALSPARLYWTTRGIDPRRLATRFDPALTTYFVAGLFFFTGSAAFWAPLPLFLTDLGFDSGRVFACYLASSLGSAACYGAAGRLSARVDDRILQSGTLAVRAVLFPAVLAVAGLGTAAFGTAGLLLGGIGITWAGIAVVGTAIVTRLAPPAARGELLGAYVALGAIGGGIGGVLGGWAATASYAVAFAVAGGLVLVGAVLVAALVALSSGDGKAASAASVPDSVPAGTVEEPPTD